MKWLERHSFLLWNVRGIPALPTSKNLHVLIRKAQFTRRDSSVIMKVTSRWREPAHRSRCGTCMKKKTKEKKSREHILSREERILFYISEKDIWKQGKTVNPVIKRLGEKGPVYDDGVHVIYVNAEVNDGSRIAKLMEYFKTADPEDDSEGELSKRVHYLKREKEELT